MTLPPSLCALRHRPFRLFFVGQTISMAGTWMQSVALGWLVYRTTGSPFWLGMTTFLGQIPSLVIAPVAGVWIDGGDRRRIVLLTQSLSFAQAAILAAIVLVGLSNMTAILVLSLWLGVVSAVDLPARQSFLIELVKDREDLGNAIALNSAMFNSARLIGPSLAGALLAATGEGFVFLVNALTYLPVLAALLAIRGASPPRASTGDMRPSLAAGLSFVAASRPLRAVLVNVAITSLLATPYLVLMPIYARDILGGGPRTLGMLVGAIGGGALAGSFYIAALARPDRWRPRIASCGALLGVALAALASASGRCVALGALVVAGFASTTLFASSNTFLQTAVEEEMRGRIMSLYAMAISGVAPLGSLLAGSLASGLGAPATVLGCGVSSLAASALFLRLTQAPPLPSGATNAAVRDEPAARARAAAPPGPPRRT